MCKIEFNLDESAFVTVNVVDIMGTLMETILADHRPAGSYNIDFNHEKLIPGKYYFKVFVEKQINGSVKSMHLLKTGHVNINPIS